MIKPTPGRIVWFVPGNWDKITWHGRHLDNGHPAKLPLAAMVAHVWHDHMVNLNVTDSDGHNHARTSVHLVQEGDEAPLPGEAYCMWMPYQVGQAKKAEAAETTLAEHRAANAAKLAAKPGIDPFDEPKPAA